MNHMKCLCFFMLFCVLGGVSFSPTLGGPRRCRQLTLCGHQVCIPSDSMKIKQRSSLLTFIFIRAMKCDVTRHGKRTKRGVLDDGAKSMTRYFINNFIDQERQVGIDIMLGYTNGTAALSHVHVDLQCMSPVRHTNDKVSTEANCDRASHRFELDNAKRHRGRIEVGRDDITGDTINKSDDPKQRFPSLVNNILRGIEEYMDSTLSK